MIDLVEGVLTEFAERAAGPLAVAPDGFHEVSYSHANVQVANELARRWRAARAGREVRPAIAERPLAKDRLAQKRAWWHANKAKVRPPRRAASPRPGGRPLPEPPRP